MKVELEPRYNITVIGAPGVGKSALSLQFLYQEFIEDYEPTKVDSYQTYIEQEGGEVCVQITDTAGHEDYVSVRETFLRNGEGFLAVFSLTDRDSFTHLTELCAQVKLAKGLSPPQLPFLVVGNKRDLEGARVVTRAEAQELAAELGVHYMESSARNNENVSEAFLKITGLTIQARMPDVLEQEKRGKRKFKGLKKWLCGFV